MIAHTKRVRILVFAATVAIALVTPMTAHSRAGTETMSQTGTLTATQNRINLALENWMSTYGVTNSGLAVVRDNRLVG